MTALEQDVGDPVMMFDKEKQSSFIEINSVAVDIIFLCIRLTFFLLFHAIGSDLMIRVFFYLRSLWCIDSTYNLSFAPQKPMYR